MPTMASRKAMEENEASTRVWKRGSAVEAYSKSCMLAIARMGRSLSTSQTCARKAGARLAVFAFERTTKLTSCTKNGTCTCATGWSIVMYRDAGFSCRIDPATPTTVIQSSSALGLSAKLMRLPMGFWFGQKRRGGECSPTPPGGGVLGGGVVDDRAPARGDGRGFQGVVFVERPAALEWDAHRPKVAGADGRLGDDHVRRRLLVTQFEISLDKGVGHRQPVHQARSSHTVHA